MWTQNNLKVMFDISTRCNAGCPQCHRTDVNNISKKVSWLPDVVWSLENFKKAIPPKMAKMMYNADFCGTWGDPITNNNLIDIVEYLVKENPNIKIDINTNGSLRNEEWWWKLGVTGGKNICVVFAVEGINQEMHEHYRQNTYLNKILENMLILSNTLAHIKTQCLVWKHNENHLQEIEDLCIKHGSKSHVLMKTDRFGDKEADGDNYFFVHKGKEKVLQQTSWQVENNNSDIVQTSRRRYKREEKKLPGTPMHLVRNLRMKKQKMNITCEWGNKNKVVINPDGQVWPCCFFCNTTFKSKFTNANDSKFQNNPVMMEYNKSKSDLNVFNNSLDKIINDKWYKTTLPNSWESNEPVNQCVRYCGEKSQIKKMLDGIDVEN